MLKMIKAILMALGAVFILLITYIYFLANFKWGEDIARTIIYFDTPVDSEYMIGLHSFMYRIPKINCGDISGDNFNCEIGSSTEINFTKQSAVIYSDLIFTFPELRHSIPLDHAQAINSIAYYLEENYRIEPTYYSGMDFDIEPG